MQSGDDIEHRLRKAAPRPRAEFVDELERRLLPPAGQRAPSRLKAGAAIATALAAVTAVLGVVGVLPGGFAGDRPVDATQRCRTVLVERTERRATFVVGRDGEMRVRFRPQVVRRPVTRCR